MSDRSRTRPPRSRARSVVWGLSYTSLLLVAQFVQGVLVVPLYLRHVDVQLYGAWLATGNVVAMLALVDPGIGDIIRLRASHALGARDTRAVATIVGTGLALMAAVIAVLAAAGAAVSLFLPQLLRLEERWRGDLRSALFVAIAAMGCQLLAYVLGNVLEATQRQLELGIVSLVALAVGVAATVWLLTQTSLGVMALAAGGLVRGLLSVIALAPLAVRAVRVEGVERLAWSRAEAQAIKRTAVVIFSSRVISTVAQQADPVLTSALLGPGATVVLSLNARPREFLQYIPSRLNFAAVPALAHRVGAEAHDGPDARSETARLAWGVIALSTAAATVLMACYVALGRAFFDVWLAGQQFGGRRLLVLLGGSAIVVMFKESFGYVASAYGQLSKTSALNAAEALLRVLLSGALIAGLGIEGAPIAAAVAAAIVIVPNLRLVLRCTGAREYARRVVVQAAAGAALALPAALAFSVLAPRFGSWGQFLAAGAPVAVVATALVLGVSPFARDAVVAGLARAFGRSPARSQVAHGRASQASILPGGER